MKRVLCGLLSGLTLLLLAACGGTAAPSASASPPPSDSPSPEAPAAVTEFARAYLAKTAETCGFAVAETQLTGVTLVAGYDLLPGASVEVYRMAFRLKPEDPDKVVLAGGMQTDDQGWVLQTGSPGDPCLVVENASGTYSLLGETWDGELPADAGWEGRVGALLISRGAEQGDDTMVQAGQRAVCRAFLGKADAAMAPLLGTAPTEGEPYTDGDGHVWRKLSGYEKLGEQRMDDQVLGSLYTVFPKELADAFFARCVYVPDSVFLEKDGGLYVRQDAAKLLGWDYTADLSTLAVNDHGNPEADSLEFTADGTGRGGRIQWYFSLSRDNGVFRFHSYYDMASEGRGVPAEFAVLIGDEWFGLESGEAPAALGQPEQVDKDPNNAYNGTGFWRTDRYDGVSATRYDDGTGDAAHGVVTMEVTRGGLPTWRGVQVGDGMDAVTAAYPEAASSTYYLTGDIAVPCLSYQAFPNGPGYRMDFLFDENEILTRILIKNEFD